MEHNEQNYNFYAMISRMKYIDRWALMRNMREENLSEHSLEVSIIAHALAVIGNTYFDKNLNAEKAALIGLYHDASEIITGDMPTPIKYFNSDIKNSFKSIEDIACHKLLSMLPEEMASSYQELFFKKDEDEYLWRLVKAADKLSALIKCLEETGACNKEFDNALASTQEILNNMTVDLPEVKYFMKHFLKAYGKNLDQLQGN